MPIPVDHWPVLSVNPDRIGELPDTLVLRIVFDVEHGYRMLRIPYTDFDRIPEILSETMNGDRR